MLKLEGLTFRPWQDFLQSLTETSTKNNFIVTDGWTDSLNWPYGIIHIVSELREIAIVLQENLEAMINGTLKIIHWCNCEEN